VKKIIEFRFWLIAALAVMVFIPFMAYQQHRASDKYKDHRAEYCSSLVATPDQKKTCIEKRANADDYLPWIYELFSWPLGITTWAIIATGFAIVWQGNETRKAANATRDSVKIAQTSHRVARNKDKPRFSITVDSEDLINSRPFVNFSIICRCPTPAYSCIGNAVAFVRSKGDYSFPELYHSIDIPSIIEEPSIYSGSAPVIGEGGINSMSLSSKDKFENCELVILLCVHILFEDVYGKRDFMFSRVLESSGLRNLDGSNFRSWGDGPASLNWDKEYDEDNTHPQQKPLPISMRPLL
jgi:hypothetical protein